MGWRRRARLGKREEGESPQRIVQRAEQNRGTLRMGLEEAISPVYGTILDPRLVHVANVAPRATILRAAQQAVGNQALLRLLQVRRVVSQPDDAYERDAEWMAAAAIHSSEAKLHRQVEGEKVWQGKRFSGQTVALAQRSRNTNRGAPALGRAVDKTASSIQTLLPRNNLAAQIARRKGAGQPLDRETKRFMERGFGYDFGSVRVHTDSFAAQMTGNLGAEAFAMGKDIFFRSGNYQPKSTNGKKLLAHELAHVVQCEGKNKRIACWGPGVHRRITREVGLGMRMPGDFVFHLEGASTAMDFRAASMAYAFNVLALGLAVPANEAPNHGEGGLYSEADRGVAAAVNIARQDQYLREAIRHQQEYDGLANADASIRELARKAGEVREQLGHALHVAQDRGAHGEGQRGAGHDQDAYDCDDPAENSGGYAEAQRNSQEVLTRFAQGSGSAAFARARTAGPEEGPGRGR